MAITSFIAGEAISAGDAVFLNAVGLLFKSSSLGLGQASAIGISLDSSSLGSLTRVDTDSVYTALSGFVPGETRYVSLLSSGTTQSYSAWAAELNASVYSGAYLTRVGKAISTSGLSIEISPPLFVLRPV